MNRSWIVWAGLALLIPLAGCASRDPGPHAGGELPLDEDGGGIAHVSGTVQRQPFAPEAVAAVGHR